MWPVIPARNPTFSQSPLPVASPSAAASTVPATSSSTTRRIPSSTARRTSARVLRSTRKPTGMPRIKREGSGEIPLEQQQHLRELRASRRHRKIMRRLGGAKVKAEPEEEQGAGVDGSIQRYEPAPTSRASQGSRGHYVIPQRRA